MLFFKSEKKTFCDGFTDGYTAGYCSEMNACIKPVIPVCPVAPVGQNDYEGGYAVGWKKGLKDNK